MFSAGAEVFDVTGAVVTVGSSTDKVTINGTSGITIRENNVDSISLTDGVIVVGSSTDKVTINGTSGITIKENNKDNISLVDGTIKIGVDENDSTFVQIDSDSVDIIEDVGGTDTTVATFGLATVIGPVANSKSRIELSSGIVKIINRNGSGTDATAIQLAADGTATFTGTVTAGAGNIGGFHIGATDLWGGNASLTNAATQIVLGDIADGGTPKIALGGTANSLSLTAGTGFYVDGGGDFRVGLNQGVGISFDSSAGLLVMSSSAFLLGTSGSAPTTGAYVSGSNGELEISSSNFFLKSDGSLNAGSGNFTLDTGGNVGVLGDIKTAPTGQRIHLDSSNNRLDFHNSAANVVRIGEEIFGYSGNPDGILLKNGGRLYAASSIADDGDNAGFPLVASNYLLTGGGNGTFQGNGDRTAVRGRVVADMFQNLDGDATSTTLMQGVLGQVTIGGHEAQGGAQAWSPRSFGIHGKIRYLGDNDISTITLVNYTCGRIF